MGAWQPWPTAKVGDGDMIDLLGYFYAMHGCYQAMPQFEKDALLEWERENLNGDVGTSDWPGWEKYLGLKPPSGPAKPVKHKVVMSFALRMRVFERDGFKCKKCGIQKDLTADHVIPESQGGLTTLDNLQTLCRLCNLRKGSKAEA